MSLRCADSLRPLFRMQRPLRFFSRMTAAQDNLEKLAGALRAAPLRVKMVSLMAPDIEWISVVDFNVQDRGPAEVMQKVFAPLMQDWESFSPAPSESIVDGSKVISLGPACIYTNATRSQVAPTGLLHKENHYVPFATC